MTIQDAIAPFDTEIRKSFDYSEIADALASINNAEQNKPEYKYEMMAFSLVTSQKENFYEPRFTYSDENGNPIYVPDIKDITSEEVAYWKSRYAECKNPLLIIRYAGLVWEFSSKVGIGKHPSNLYRLYVDNMLRVCNEEYCTHPTVTTLVLERLFSITRKQKDDLQLTKAAFNTFEKKYAKDEKIRYWSARFLLMIKNKDCFTDDEKSSLLKEHEERLMRLYAPNNGEKINPWTVKDQAEILAQYYQSVQKKEDIKRVLDIVKNTFLHESTNMSQLQLMGNLEQIYERYIHYGLKEEATGLQTKIQDAGAKSFSEFKSCMTEYNLTKELHEQAEAMFGNEISSVGERWINFGVYFIPCKSKEKDLLKKTAKDYPFTFMMPTQLMDSKGRLTSVIGSYENDEEGQLILYMTQKMNISSPFLCDAISILKASNTLSTNEVMERFINKPLFEEDRHSIIREAIDYFMNEKYVEFCHLIIPQIEHAILKLVEIGNCSILKSQRNGKGFQLKTLDELLREKPVIDAFTEDGAFYLRLVLTDQRALNIRNQLCHGILPPSQFGLFTAARLLHVIVMLGMIEYTTVSEYED